MEELVRGHLEGRLELVVVAVHMEEASSVAAYVAGQEGLVVLELEGGQHCREAPMTGLKMKMTPAAVVPGGRLRDFLELEGAALDQRVPELVLAPVVEEARLALVCPA